MANTTDNIGLHIWNTDQDSIRRTEFTENFNKIDRSLVGLPNLDIKATSVSISNIGAIDGYDQLAYFNKVFDRIKIQGLEVILCTSHNITAPDSSMYTHHTKEQIQAIIDLAVSKGIKIAMLKPHIVMNWSDSFSRNTYQPVNMDSFFTNWLAELMFIADIANRNNIEWISIECEQTQTTAGSPTTHYYSQWKSITDALRASYPNLLLTVSSHGNEVINLSKHFLADNTNYSIYDLVDAIGYNLYLSFYPEYYNPSSPNITVQDCDKALYLDSGKNKLMNRISNLNNYWKKPVIITEYGVMPLTGGLIKPIATGLGTESYDVQALAYQALFDTVMPLPYVLGFALWHTNAPWSYMKLDGSTTSSEQLIINYVRGGKI